MGGCALPAPLTTAVLRLDLRRMWSRQIATPRAITITMKATAHPMIVYTVECRYARSDSLNSFSVLPCCCLAYWAASLFLMLNSMTASQQGYMNLQSGLVSGSQQYSVGSMHRKSNSGQTILPLQGS